MNRTVKDIGYSILFAIVAIIIVFLLVYIIPSPALFDGFSMSDKADTIGNAINGITAPFIGLLGASLVFYTIILQIRANKMVQAQWLFDTYLRLFQDVKNFYENITVIFHPYQGSPQTDQMHKGEQAFRTAIDKSISLISGQYKAFKDLESVLRDLNFLIDEMDKNTFQQKKYLHYSIIAFYFDSVQKIAFKLKDKYEKEGDEMKKANFIILLNMVHPKIERMQQNIDKL